MVSNTISAVIVDYDKGAVITWAAMNDTDVGTGVNSMPYDEMTIQAVGDGTSVAVQGSNDGGTTWGAMNTAVSVNVSGNKILRVLERPALMRVVCTGGTSTSVYMSASKKAY